MKYEILGIDLGNTIIKGHQVLPDAFRVIKRLINERFGEGVYIISRVDEEQEIRARAFIMGEDFQWQLAIPIERVYFCRERHEKGLICKNIFATHCIDDRPEVMASMPGCVLDRILLDPDEADLKRFASKIGKVFIARTWRDVERHLLPPKSH